MPVVVIGGVVVALSDVLIILSVGAMLYVATATKGAFVRPFADLLAAIPVIGGQLADIVSTGWDSVIAGLQRNLDDAVSSLTAMLDLLHGSYQLVLNGLTGTAEWLGYWTGQALGGLSDLAGSLGSQIAQLIAQVQVFAKHIPELFQDVVHLIDQVAQLIAHGIQDLIDASLHTFQVTVNDLIRAALVPVHLAIHSVRELVHTYHSIEVATREAEVAQLGQAIDGTRAALNTRIHGVEGDVAALDTQVTSIDGELGTILTEIGTIAAGTTLVGLITQVATRLTNMERECVDPTCGFLGPQLPILNALEDVATLALVGGMITAAATQPQAAARSGVTVVDTLVPQVLGLFQGITGVRVQ